MATLPGIVSASCAMPDIHRGYGFPVGGVAEADTDAGGVGFGISCGVRLPATAGGSSNRYCPRSWTAWAR
ncbi:RtcB family protein [Streptomyces sp. Wb2n-11]|uniref:RtcB family protein n=1 Tax=Streptomyces sp. Wb2n-11 TaxID=1030533 RepID=UPI000B16EE28|nr:RtcB family protein [Streptomyces sp. Wb2n-11]